ncbi:hypothetical protein ACFFMN_42670 [Planobispora siamensis]|nr:hypothetical protein [Planobispora siamensis]
MSSTTDIAAAAHATSEGIGRAQQAAGELSRMSGELRELVAASATEKSPGCRGIPEETGIRGAPAPCAGGGRRGGTTEETGARSREPLARPGRGPSAGTSRVAGSRAVGGNLSRGRVAGRR